MQKKAAHRPHPLRQLATAALLAAFSAAAQAQIVEHLLEPTDLANARAALEDSIVAEGLMPASVSEFGDMLKRTAADLGHPADIYRDAVILTFCSAQVAGRMTSENPRHIALCPLSMALYNLPSEPQRVYLTYRLPATGTPGGAQAEALLGRIARRTAESLGLDGTRMVQ